MRFYNPHVVVKCTTNFLLSDALKTPTSLCQNRHKFEFLHNGWSPDIRITVNPVRIGLLLDYGQGTLSFFNVELEQHLHTLHCQFQRYVKPCFALDNPGVLTLHNGIATPRYTQLI